MKNLQVAIIGGGLAGCECALFLAQHQIHVTLFEQKPLKFSPAHISPLLGELVCSNSFRSNELTTGIGLLKQELRELNSPLMSIADKTSIPSGKALAVNREKFASTITNLIQNSPYIKLVHEEIESLTSPLLSHANCTVVATGPLTSHALSQSLIEHIGNTYLYFYDAIAPIVMTDSIDMSVAFWASRYDEESSDYLNCPMTKEEYTIFYNALLEGEKAPTHNFEDEKHFEGCMPIETLASRGEKTLVYGPLKPVGFTDPRTGHRPYAVLQLRPENINKSMCNLVGCQTKLTYPAQNTVFRLVPGLTNAEFVRFGSMHRNTYINAPTLLTDQLTLKTNPNIHLAGQITGVEGYVESIASGLWVGMLILAKQKNIVLSRPPGTSALGGLLNHLSIQTKTFQPSNAHFGLTPELNEKVKKKDRKQLYSSRARNHFQLWKTDNPLFFL